MRHSRREVMSEHYRLYMRKHIFNSRYLVRNIQLAVCVLVLAVMAVLALCIVVKGDSSSKKSVTEHVQNALFANSEEEKQAERIAETDTAVTEADLTSEQDTEAQTQENTETEAVEYTMEEIPAVAVAEPVEEEGEFAHKCIANVDETLNVRSEPNAEAEFVGAMNPGAIAIVEGTEGDWTRIKSGDVEGYVKSEYVLTGSVAESFAEDYVTLRGTVLENGVNIRASQSTDSDILVVMDENDTVTVLEKVEEPETAGEGEIQWVPVMLEDGQVGYVSSDFINVEELYEIAVSAEELQRIAEEEARRLAEEEAARQAAAAAAMAAATSAKDSTAYQGATTTPVTASESGECIGTFTVTGYCGCERCSGGNNRTATGTVPTEGRTIAADPNVLPYGTKVVINGIVYTVEDCGVSGNHVDIFFADHESASAFGRKSIKVYKY